MIGQCLDLIPISCSSVQVSLIATHTLSIISEVDLELVLNVRSVDLFGNPF